MVTAVRRAHAADAAVLARVAAVTFPLACPPHTTAEAQAEFIAGHLQSEHFAGYLADPERVLLLAEVDGHAAGYSMLVFGDPGDPSVAAVVSERPTVELSKFYVMADHHGTGLAAALMDASIETARDRGVASAWLGVNEENERANRFYERHGFVVVGSKKFRVGEVDEDDYVRCRSISSSR